MVVVDVAVVAVVVVGGGRGVVVVANVVSRLWQDQVYFHG